MTFINNYDYLSKDFWGDLSFLLYFKSKSAEGTCKDTEVGVSSVYGGRLLQRGTRGCRVRLMLKKCVRSSYP